MKNLQLQLLFGFIQLYIAMCRGFEVKRLQTGPSVIDEHTNAQSSRGSELCRSVPTRILRQVLGSAYNEYYMSYEPPSYLLMPNTGSSEEREIQYKRSDDATQVNGSTSLVHPFYIDKDYSEVLSEEPAWKIQPGRDAPPINDRPSRQVSSGRHYAGARHPEAGEDSSVPDSVIDAIVRLGHRQFKWHCDAPLIWRDLGAEYFPRYVLSADCYHSKCRGRRFGCESRSFGIKVLRRRKGVCVPGYTLDDDTLDMGQDLMPGSLRELWVWEVRAEVAFALSLRSLFVHKAHQTYQLGQNV